MKVTTEITTTKGTILYVMEQIYLKGYSDGKKGIDTTFNPSTVASIAEQFTKDLEKYANTKERF